MNTDTITLDQIVTFAILMESGAGILTKAPRYITEKFLYCMEENEPRNLEGILDDNNKAKLDRWRERWKSLT